MATIVTDLISHLQCGETIAANDAVYIDDITGKVGLYNPTIPTQVFAGIAKEAGVLDDFIRVVQTGRVKGFSGLTPGQFVYASTTVPGAFQLTEPIASQKVILGIAKSATELVINGGLGIKPGGAGGGGGGLDVYHTQDMEGLADASGFTTGNDVVFLNAGSMAGTLALDEVSPISGAKSLKYTQAAGSLNDYFASEVIDVELKQQNNDSGMTLYFEYDGADDDIKLVVWDETNSEELTTGVELIKTTGKATRYALSFYVPVTCTQIRWGAQVLVENIGAVLKIDDVEITSNPFVEADLSEENHFSARIGSGGAIISQDVPWIQSVGNPSGGTYTVVFTPGFFTVPPALTTGGGDVNDGSARIGEGTVTTSGVTIYTGISDNSGPTARNIPFALHASRQGSDYSVGSPHVLTPARSSSTVTKVLNADETTSGITLSDLTFSDLVIGNKDEIALTAQLGGISGSVNEIGIRHNGVEIGKAQSYGGGSSVQFVSTVSVKFTATATSLTFLTGFTGSGFVQGNGTQSETFAQLTNLTSQFLAAIPTPKVAYLKDVKTSGTNGGDFNSGSYVTRVLNTVEGDSGFVSLSGNQFTLQPGKYQIEAHAPGHLCGAHKAKVYNVTNSVDAIIGAYASSETASGTGTRSVVDGTLTLTSPKVFELRHRCTNTKASNGLGFPCAFGDSEIYAVVKITKLA